MNLDVSRRLKPFEALAMSRKVPSATIWPVISLSGDTPTRTMPPWPLRKAQSVSSGAGQLAGALLELYGGGFAAADEGFYSQDCHSDLAPPAVNRILGRRGRGGA